MHDACTSLTLRTDRIATQGTPHILPDLICVVLRVPVHALRLFLVC